MEGTAAEKKEKSIRVTQKKKRQMNIKAIQAKRHQKKEIRKEAADAVEYKNCELVIGYFYGFYVPSMCSLRASCAAKASWHVIYP